MWIAIQNAVGARQGVGGGPGPTPPPYTPPLDGATDILAAYSVRKLLSAYSGPCMEVHRISDGAKQDIYFDSEGLVNTADIIAFASGSDLEVSTWYDQGPLSNHAIIAPLAPSGQPLIYTSSGGLQTINGVPSILGGGQRSWNLTSDITTANSIFDVRFTSSNISTSNNFLYGNSSSFDYHSGSNGTNNIYLHPTFSATYVQGGNNYEVGILRDFTTYGYPSRYVILSMLHTSASGRINQLSQDRSQPGRSWGGSWQESIIFGADKTSSRTTLESNFNSYYQVTNLPDYTSGFLADYSGAAAAYSVRKLSNTAIKCMRVRRTVAPFDELDIGFTAGGDLDEAAIVAFGAGNPLVVSRWYDQSGKSNHAVQETPGLQPQIYNGTAVITDNGKPALSCDLDRFELGSTISLTSGYSAIHVSQQSGRDSASFGTSFNYNYVTLYQNTDVWFYHNTAGRTIPYVVPLNTQQLHWLNWTGSTVGIGINGGTLSTGALSASASINRLLNAAGNTQQGWRGLVQEMIVYPTDKNAAGQRPAIETNINDYYYAYSTSGFVVDYPGAIAAYSVRQLGNRQRYAMRVRRLGGAADYLDVGFVAGELDTQAIIDFGGSDTLGVEVWYDQSPSGNDAVQTSPGLQPIIYNGTSVITENGKPAVEFVDGVVNTMDIGYNISNTALSAFTVMRNSGTGRASGIQTTGAAPYRDGWVIACDNTLVRTWYDIDGAANYDRVEVAAAGNVQNLSSLILTAPNIDFRVNGGASVTKTNLWASTDPLNIHQWYPDKGATIQEIVVYDDAKNNTDRSGIELNIMTYYGIP